MPEAGIPNQATNWWLIGYLAGVTVTVLYLLRDLWRLWSLYRRARVCRDGRWVIAETGVAHGPFSFGHIIFVCSREQYTTTQWQMVLQHEQQHHRSRHILDLVLMQLALILLWFHPLVYSYRYKLRLLHEYEADSLQQENIQTYGRFLLEQACLKPAPVLTHSFHASPLKNRIHMITRTTSKRRAQYRLLLLLPMMSIFIWCCTKSRTNVAVDIKDRKAMLHGINVEYSKPTAADTLQLNPGSSAAEIVTVAMESVPVKLNNQEILRPEKTGTTIQCLNPGPEFSIRYLIAHTDMEKGLQKMVDGEYFIGLMDVIVDPSGHIVYYNMLFPQNMAITTDKNGIQTAKPNGLTDADKADIQKAASAALIGGDIKFSTIKNEQGHPAPYFLLDDQNWSRTFEASTKFTIKNHKIISYAKSRA
jgi:hypothetical protein